MLNHSRAKYKKEILNSVPASLCIPYLRHVDEFTVKTKKGDFVRMYEIKGVPFQTLSDEDKLSWNKIKEKLIKSIRNPRIAIWTNLVRDKYDSRLVSNYSNPFCQELSDKYNQTVLKDVYRNRYFFSVVLLGNTGMESFRDSIDKDGMLAEQQENLKLLDSKCADIVEDFSSAKIVSLKLVEKNGRLFSDAANLIGRLFNGEWSEQIVTKNDLRETIPTNAVLFSKEVIEQRGISKTSYGAMLTVKDYEGKTDIGQFDELLGLPFEFILSQSFTYMSDKKAHERIEDVLASMEATQDKAQSQQEDLALLQDQLTSGDVCLGEFHITLHSSDESINTATKNLDTASSILRRGGISSQRAFLDAEPSFLAQMPGNHSEITYCAPVTSTNFGHSNSFHNLPEGKRYRNHWGDAVCTLKTSARTAFDFNFHVADVGHMSVYGMTGSGKSLLQNFLVFMAQKFKPRVNIFDSERNAAPLIKVLGGEYFNLEHGEDSGFAPLQMDITEFNKDFCKELIKLLVTSFIKKYSLNDMNKVSDAIESVMSERVPKSNRTLTSLLQFLPNTGEESLYERLLPWTKGQPKGWIFDNDCDKFNLTAKNNAFNADNILSQKEARTPIMAYIWHKMESTYDGTPQINLFDEGWQLTDDEYFEGKMKGGFKKGRKGNLLNIFTTQEPEDSVNSSIHSTIKGQTATTILLANPQASWGVYKELNVTYKEFEMIKELSLESRNFLIKQGGMSVVIDFNLIGIKDFLPVLSASKSMLPVFDACVDKYSDKWLSHYIEKVKYV